MSPKTVTKPPTDRQLWRRLLARAHPDGGGDEALFVWANNVRELVCNGGNGQAPPGQAKPRAYERPRRREEEPASVPFNSVYGFYYLTRRALEVADEVEEPFRSVLLLLEGVRGEGKGGESRGCTYKQLAAVAYRAGFTKAERVRFYRIAESIPLSRRHAGYLIERLVEGGTHPRSDCERYRAFSKGWL